MVLALLDGNDEEGFAVDEEEERFVLLRAAGGSVELSSAGVPMVVAAMRAEQSSEEGRTKKGSL